MPRIPRPDLIGQVIQTITAPIIDSPSESFVRAQWSANNQAGLNDALKHFFDGDPEAKAWLPSSWKLAAALSITATDYADTLEHFPTAQPAVAYQHTPDQIRSAIVPKGLTERSDAGIDVRVVALRLGSGPLRATLGFQETDGFFIPLDTQLHGAIFNSKDTATLYPGTQLI